MSQDLIYQQLLDHLPPRWFQQTRRDRSGPFHDLLWGLSGLLFEGQTVLEYAQRAVIPATSYGFWASLHLVSIGLSRRRGESDEQAIARYINEFAPSRNTLAGLERSLSLLGVDARIETDFALGRFGELRLVLDDEDLDWTQLNTGWFRQFAEEWIANGIWPSLDINLPCIKQLPFPPFTHDTSFSNFRHLPFWEAPAFADGLNGLRLRNSRNSVFSVTATEWQEYSWFLRQLHDDTHALAPGSIFVYLANACPYLDVVLESNLLVQYPPYQTPPPFLVDGFDFFDTFPRTGAQFVSPDQIEEEILQVIGNYPEVYRHTDPFSGDFFYAYGWFYYPAEDSVLLSTISTGYWIPDWLNLPYQEPPTEQTTVSEFNRPHGLGDFSHAWDYDQPFDSDYPDRWLYYDADTGTYTVTTSIPGFSGWIPNVRAGFTRRWVTEFLEVIIDPDDITYSFDRSLFGDWHILATTNLGILTMPLDAGYWTDANGLQRSSVIVLDGNSSYLALEFLLPAGQAKTISAIEVILGSETIAVQSPLNFDLNQSENFAVLVRIRNNTTTVVLTP